MIYIITFISIFIASPSHIQCIRYVYASSGENITLENLWIEGQPNNLQHVKGDEEGEDCIEFPTSWLNNSASAGFWNDAPCSDKIESICEMWFLYETEFSNTVHNVHIYIYIYIHRFQTKKKMLLSFRDTDVEDSSW